MLKKRLTIRTRVGYRVDLLNHQTMPSKPWSCSILQNHDLGHPWSILLNLSFSCSFLLNLAKHWSWLILQVLERSWAVSWVPSFHAINSSSWLIKSTKRNIFDFNYLSKKIYKGSSHHQRNSPHFLSLDTMSRLK